jgi:phosphoglycolate phosphatase
VGVTYGVHTPQVLQQYQPDYIADNVERLHEFLIQKCAACVDA